MSFTMRRGAGRPVKRILMGVAPEPAVARDALANPQALDVFVSMALRAGGRDRALPRMLP
jgi:hypothetical protein